VSGCDEGGKDEPAKPPEPPEKKQQWRVDWCDDARAEAITLAITTFLVGGDASDRLGERVPRRPLQVLQGL